jgi:hypothetical protein
MSDQTRYQLFSDPKGDMLLQIDTWTGDTWYLVTGVKNRVKWYGWKLVLSSAETDRREQEAWKEEARGLLEKVCDSGDAVLASEARAFLAREEGTEGE